MAGKKLTLAGLVRNAGRVPATDLRRTQDHPLNQNLGARQPRIVPRPKPRAK